MPSQVTHNDKFSNYKKIGSPHGLTSKKIAREKN